jgi:hypothetical protein
MFIYFGSVMAMMLFALLAPKAVFIESTCADGTEQFLANLYDKVLTFLLLQFLFCPN